MIKVTTRDSLMAWLDGLAQSAPDGRTLIAPKAVGEQILYRPVGGSSEIAAFRAGYINADLSVKEYFLPATQVLFSVVRDEGGIRIQEAPSEEERVIFGLRPCDARALRVLDALFIDQEPVDSYYAERREKTTLVGLACREMGQECFCASLGLAPDDASDVDLMLTETDGGYTVQGVTEKGRRILGDLPLADAPAASVEESLPEPAVREETPVLAAVSSAMETWPEHFDHAYWARLADRCLSCRLCAYVCPTCRCFDVRDDQLPNGDIRRLRTWDGCMSEGYRRIAGGHNPRPTKAERLRNRFYCKFCYYPQDYGPVACVGCGRCIDKCPVNVDVVEVLEDVAVLEHAGA